MTDTPRQRRTAASILEIIQQRLSHEQMMLAQDEDEASMRRTRVTVLESILKDAEKNGSDDAE